MTTISTASIDATKPEATSATTASVRANFAEIITQLTNAGTDIDGIISGGTTLTNVDINSGNIDGTIIGAASAAALTCTTFTSTGIDATAATATALTIDENENIGCGVIPKSVWSAGWSAIQNGGLAALFSGTSQVAGQSLYLSNNIYLEGSLKHIVNDEASSYIQQNGRHLFQSAVAAAAGTNAALATLVEIDLKGNLLIGGNAAGTNAAKVLAIPNGTVPGSSPADMIQIYSKDSSDGTANSTLGIRTEQAVEAIGTFTPSHKLKVWINETEYSIQLDAV